MRGPPTDQTPAPFDNEGESVIHDTTPPTDSSMEDGDNND